MLPEANRFIHHSELSPPDPNSPLATEVNAYRREVARLLAEGHEGRYVLIKGEQVLGVWETRDDARAEGYRRFLLQPFLVHQVCERERVLIPRIGYS